MLNKLSFNLMNELNESETKAIQIKKKVFMEGSDVRVEELKEEKNYVLTEDASSALDSVISGDEVYFRDPDGVAMVVRYSENYQNPEDYDEGYKSEYGGDPEELEAAKQAAEEGNVWEFVGVDDDGTETGTVYNVVYGKEELRKMLEDLREVKMIKKLEDGQIEDAKADSIEKGLYSEGEEICKECGKPLAECNCKKLNEAKNGDFIIYIKTDRGPLYVIDNETTAYEKEKAIRFPTKSEADEFKNEFIKNTNNDINLSDKFIVAQLKEAAPIDTSKEDKLASLKTQLEKDGDQLADDEKAAIEDEIANLEKELQEGCDKSLKEDYSERLGGYPEDFISDMKSLLYQLRTIEVENFGTNLAKQIVYDFEETVENQMKMIANKYDLEESEKIEKKPVVEAAQTEVKDLQVIKEQGNVYMLEDKSEGTRYIVGENYNLSEGEIENAEIYESKEEADKDYLDRCEVIKDGEEFNTKEDSGESGEDTVTEADKSLRQISEEEKINTLKMMDNIARKVNDEELFYNYWLAFGIPDEASEEDYEDLAEDPFYEEMEEVFKKLMKMALKDGLYDATEEELEFARKYEPKIKNVQ